MIEKSFGKIVEALAARTPTPGGGAAAALAASLGTALSLMVVRFSRGKKQNAGREEDLAAAEQFLDQQLKRALPMAERDCASFDRVSAAYAMPRQGEEQKGTRTRAIEEALAGAIVVPEEVAHLTRDVLARLQKISDTAGKSIASDLGAAVELLRAASRAAMLNVRINGNYLQDKVRGAATIQRAQAVHDEAEKCCDLLRGVVDRSLMQ